MSTPSNSTNVARPQACLEMLEEEFGLTASGLFCPQFIW